jgi:hypothetical protein
MTKETYKGFEIIGDQYLHYNKFYWEIVGHYCTLDNDDAMWDSDAHAIEAAKREIDEFLNGERPKIGK